MATHYDTLGVPATATAKEIRSAYRKIALAHHPDRSTAPGSKAVFIAATEAYQTIGDDRLRAEYDDLLRRRAESDARRTEEARVNRLREEERRRAARPTTVQREAARAASEWDDAPSAPPPTPKPPSDAADLARRMKGAHSLGRLDEADRLATELIARHPRNAEAHATRGDIARAKGRPAEALRHYAMAVQHDPRNAVYRERYEEIVTRTSVSVRGRTTVVTEVRGHPAWPAVGGLVALAAVAFGGFFPEPPVVRDAGPISTWNVPLVTGLLVAGLATGLGMGLGGLLDRVRGAGGGLALPVLLGGVAVINFWAAAMLFAALGLHSGFAAGPSRLFAATGAVTMLGLVGALMNPAIDPGQVLLWGGNLVYLGALAGWLFADAFRS